MDALLENEALSADLSLCDDSPRVNRSDAFGPGASLREPTSPLFWHAYGVRGLGIGSRSGRAQDPEGGSK